MAGRVAKTTSALPREKIQEPHSRRPGSNVAHRLDADGFEEIPFTKLQGLQSYVSERYDLTVVEVIAWQRAQEKTGAPHKEVSEKSGADGDQGMMNSEVVDDRPMPNDKLDQTGWQNEEEQPGMSTARHQVDESVEEQVNTATQTAIKPSKRKRRRQKRRQGILSQRRAPPHNSAANNQWFLKLITEGVASAGERSLDRFYSKTYEES